MCGIAPSLRGACAALLRPEDGTGQETEPSVGVQMAAKMLRSPSGYVRPEVNPALISLNASMQELEEVAQEIGSLLRDAAYATSAVAGRAAVNGRQVRD